MFVATKDVFCPVFCRDKIFLSREMFVEKNACDKSFVATNTCLSRQNICHKHTFGATKSVLSLQTCVCRDKNMLVGTNVRSRQKAKHLSRQK